MMVTEEFLEKLSSSAPVPGGGGVSALVAALAAALASMVGNLTSGKKKYAQYQEDIEAIIKSSNEYRDILYSYIEKDAQAFEPLSRAYGIPKDEPGRDEKLETALLEAALTPLELMEKISGLLPLLEELSQKGSRLAVSDVGVAAALTEASIKGAVMNVYVNTRLMKNREKAEELNYRAQGLLEQVRKGSSLVYEAVLVELR